MRIHSIVLASVLAFGPAIAAANVLYKSVDAKGVVTFSDQPPPPTSRILEERAVPSTTAGTNQSSLIVMPNNATPSAPTPMTAVTSENLLNSDAAVARANAALDQAERELAAARRSAGSPLEAMRMQQTRLSLEDDRRLEDHKRNVKLARQALLELLKERRYATVQAAAAQGDGAPRYGELRPLSQRPPFLASR